ncbi:hypothetical protein F0562_018830 [Nyssa sinensis]|uniref:PGG domain-containing protein n=1 Tax=Nyssa sinensis TaxID=561372 RepID=A0A5J4ZCD4_9ASTE|nr:hypothetical protein F0562_018830 [Nyssa sinensis]
MEIPMIRLIRKTNNIGNSILHMVGIKAEDNATEDMRSPALLLQEDLLLFEHVKKISTTYFVKHFNSEGQTAEKELYNALMRGDEVQVFELCKQIPDGPFHEVTIHKDTVLHMATYSKQIGLVIGLLSKFSDDGREKLTIVNDVGNTILHEAATTNKILPAAEKMLELAPELLTMRNVRGETALFRAAHYGKTEIFEFLAKEMDKLSESDRKLCLQRGDDTTILHIAVLAEHFELAIWIANKYQHLINAPDGDDMTALQLLTFNPTAFRSGRISSEDTNKQEDGEAQKMKSYNPISLIVDFVKSTCNFPLCEEVQKQKQRHDSALKLAKLLIEKDTSWEATKTAKDLNKPRMHKHGDTFKVPENEEEGRSGASSSKDLEGTVRAWGATLSQVEAEEEDLGERYSIEKTRETPLFLATKTGIVEIVEEILRLYPQAVEHINDKGRNILHIAIKHRRKEIFNLVERMEMPMKRLIRKIDNNGNSILHMVGAKRNHRMTEKMQSPALQLQEELLLFEVPTISTNIH